MPIKISDIRLFVIVILLCVTNSIEDTFQIFFPIKMIKIVSIIIVL